MLNDQDYTLYFDEAGYTGSDLTNEEQPYFVWHRVYIPWMNFSRLNQICL